MTQVYYDKDANPELLRGKVIGVLGYGSQGHAHALNLKDSGLKVLVGLRPGSPSQERAEKAGLKVVSLREAAQSDIIAFLLPDTDQAQVYQDFVEKGLAPGKALLFAHGFNIHFGQIKPPPSVDVIMVAPKSPGAMLRQLYTQGLGVPALIAVHQNASGKARELALAYARGIGCTRAGVLEATFAAETETDLFGEQAVLCGGVSSLLKAAFETLVEAGYPPELAYFECLHELKLITDLIYQGGLTHMRHSVSDTAEYGDYTRGPRIISAGVKREMARLLQEIRNGSFAQEWIEENRKGRPNFEAMRRQERNHPLEEVGKKLRAMMPWLKG